MQKRTVKKSKKQSISSECADVYDPATGALITDGVEGTAFVAPEDIERILGCTRAVAREHLIRAGATRPRGRGLVRLRAAVWSEYASTALGAWGIMTSRQPPAHILGEALEGLH